MYEPSRAQDAVAEEVAELYGRSSVERFDGSTNVVVRGYVDGEREPSEQVLVTADGSSVPACRAAVIYGGVFGVYQEGLITGTQTSFWEGAVEDALALNASYA